MILIFSHIQNMSVLKSATMSLRNSAVAFTPRHQGTESSNNQYLTTKSCWHLSSWSKIHREINIYAEFGAIIYVQQIPTSTNWRCQWQQETLSLEAAIRSPLNTCYPWHYWIEQMREYKQLVGHLIHDTVWTVESIEDIIGVKFIFINQEVKCIGEQFANLCGFRVDGAMDYKPIHL